jgi:hypothetical protein
MTDTEFCTSMARLYAGFAMRWFDMAAEATTDEGRAQRLAFADEDALSAEWWARKAH